MTVSNVVEEKTAAIDAIHTENVPVYTANAPVTVKYHGYGLRMEYIHFFPDAEIQNGKFESGENYENIKFTQRNYVYDEGGEIFDELTQAPEDVIYYISGNIQRPASLRVFITIFDSF